MGWSFVQTYELLVSNRTIKANSHNMTLIRTSIGIDQVHILFDNAEWLDFPVTITFAQNEDVITLPLVLTTVDSDNWVAESIVTIPYEVIDMTGSIRVTVQGNDANGNHIITAKGAPLSVKEAGDVVDGISPTYTPTIDQWQLAYQKAMNAAGLAQEVIENINSRIDDIVANVQLSIPMATKDSAGMVQIGDGIDVVNGIISSNNNNSMSSEQIIAFANLARIAAYAFDFELDENGIVKDDVRIKQSLLDDILVPKTSVDVATNDKPGIIYPDNSTITVDDDGMIHAVAISHSWDGPILTIKSLAGETSANLVGPPVIISEVTASVDDEIGTPSVVVTVGGTDTEKTFDFAFSGLKGEKGDTGPSGYVLTQEDIETISDEIIARYTLADGMRY